MKFFNIVVGVGASLLQYQANNQNILDIKSTEKLVVEKSNDWSVYRYTEFPEYSLRVKNDIQLCDPTVKQYAGYLDVQDRHFYFWFFESRSKPTSDPVLLWLNGGPGCSSFTGLLMELGPCNIVPPGNGTVPNPHSWNSNANIFFLDQPVGTGFSYSDSGKVSTSLEAAQDVYAFLRVFFQAFQKYRTLDFHITGESYAGHYIPAIAKVIVEKNVFVSPQDKINLVSIAIGNGITDALVQNEYYPDMAADTKYGPILKAYEIEQMKRQYPLCKTISKACYRWQSPITCVPAEAYCAKVAFDAFDRAGLDPYDIRLAPGDKKFDTYSNAIDAWLNRPEIQKSLGVDFPHQGCSDKVMENFLKMGDEMYPIVDYIPPLLESGLRVLIYAGDADWICNWIGNKAWVMKLDWHGKQGFNQAKDITWISKKSSKPAGEYRQFENFSFLRVYESSHFVPFDQPIHSNEFINAWIRNQSIV